MGANDFYTIAAAYTQQPTTDFTIGGQDLLLNAINMAFKFADQYHDWNSQLQGVQVTVDYLSGGDITTAVRVSDGTTPCKIKSIDGTYYKTTSNTDGKTYIVPCELDTKKSKCIFLKERLRKRYWGTADYRYRPDWMLSQHFRPISMYIFNNTIQFDPSFGPTPATITAVLDIYEPFPVFTAADLLANTTHWMFVEGFEYLLWKVLCLINPLTLQFVMRQEGYLPPPDDLWKAALQSLTLWDDSQYIGAQEGNHQR